MDCSKRQEAILRAVVEQYVQTAEPVGSGVVVERYGLDVSPATVRAEMAALEEAELLMQPHTSAGRIPTDAGYRYYIDRVMHRTDLSQHEEQSLRNELLQLRARHVQLVRSTAQLLAGLSQALAVSGVNPPELMHRSGFSLLLDDPTVRRDEEQLERLTDTFRYLDEQVDQLFDLVEAESARVMVGEENPVEELQNVSMVLSRFRLPDGEEGVVAIVGPRRMQYGKNISLVEYVRGLLESE